MRLPGDQHSLLPVLLSLFPGAASVLSTFLFFCHCSLVLPLCYQPCCSSVTVPWCCLCAINLPVLLSLFPGAASVLSTFLFFCHCSLVLPLCYQPCCSSVTVPWCCLCAINRSTEGRRTQKLKYAVLTVEEK